MCGIFAYTGKKNNASQIVFQGLKSLEYRGYDSWGIVTKDKNQKSEEKKLVVKKYVGKIGTATLDLPERNMALGHTRWATHGGATKVNAHPLLDCSGRIAIVHNGIIENYAELKKDLLKKGHQFKSQTDSEVAVHLIEEARKKKSFKEAFRWAFNQLEGLNAIVAIEADSKTFFGAKIGSPLVIGFGDKENILASDAPALLKYTNKVHFLEDGQLVQLKKEQVKIYQSKSGKRISPKIRKLNWHFEQAEKGKYPHFILKEIFDQPKVLEGIMNRAVSQVPDIAKIIKKAYGTYIVACGSASYACLAATYLFSQIAKRHINFAVGSEFSYLSGFLTDKSLVIALSQSGETIDTLESVREAKKREAKILAITNVLGSSLYREADYKILLGAGPEQAVASTKAFTAKLGILILLAYGMAGKLNEGKKVFQKAQRAVDKIFEKNNLAKVKRLADKIYKQEHIYVIGRGLSYPVALEAALKIKEISYIHAEGFAAGELKHGVIALIEKGTPCIVFAPQDETFGAVLSGAMEIKARGGFIIGISDKKHEVFDNYLPVSDCGKASIIPNTVVAQILAYYLSLKRGCDPDKPRNLAKSVTVK